MERLRAEGEISNAEHSEREGVSQPTGWRDLVELVAKGVLTKSGRGKRTVYRLAPGWEARLGGRVIAAQVWDRMSTASVAFWIVSAPFTSSIEIAKALAGWWNVSTWIEPEGPRTRMGGNGPPASATSQSL